MNEHSLTLNRPLGFSFHHRIQLTPHWGSCIRAEKLDRIWPLGVFLPVSNPVSTLRAFGSLVPSPLLTRYLLSDFSFSFRQAGLGNNPYACKKWKAITDQRGGNGIEIGKTQFVAIAGKMKVSLLSIIDWNFFCSRNKPDSFVFRILGPRLWWCQKLTITYWHVRRNTAIILMEIGHTTISLLFLQRSQENIYDPSFFPYYSPRR